MTHVRHLQRFGVAATIILIGMAPTCGEDERPDPAPPFAPKITISKETTWAVEPLRADGYVDYFEAVNRHFGRDVTVEENAAVLLYQALGPRPDRVRMPDMLFKRMGLEPLPDEGNYFVTLGNWVQQQLDPPADLKAILDQQTQAGARPWTKAEFPLIAAWLDHNAGPLRTVTTAMERPRYFLPVATSRNGALIDVLLPGVQESRDVARALKVRAMRELAEGSQVDAWRDLMTLHRLGRHVGHGTTLIEFLVGVAIESMAIEGELRFLSETQPSAKLLARYRKQLDQLPPRATAIEKLDVGERAMSLDAIHHIARGTMNLQQVANLAGDGGPLDKLMAGLAAQSLDWDLILKSMNGWYDRICKISRQANYRDQLAGMRQLDQDLKNLAAKRQGAGALWTLLGGQQAMSQAMADVLVAMLLPAANQCFVAEARLIQRMSNLEIAMALAAWRSEHGAYPESLEALAPLSLAAAPTDLFNGQPLRYARTADGYRFYSVGNNEVDEEGRSFEDQPRGDDLVVRMPLPVPAQ